MNTKSQQGFTLYELLITLLVVGVVLMLGVPNFRDFAQNSRMTGTANDLHAAFQMARTEAARAKTNITICASADPLSGAATCDGTWDQGFIVFIDNDASRSRNDAAETVLRAHPALHEDVMLRIRDNASYFMYASSGLGRLDTANTVAVSQIVVCDERGNITAAGGNSAARLFVATPLGRATIVRDLDRIDDALTLMGATCP